MAQKSNAAKWKFRRAGILFESEIRICRQKMDIVYIDKCWYEIQEQK
jgi:hypothetical protein